MLNNLSGTERVELVNDEGELLLFPVIYFTFRHTDLCHLQENRSHPGGAGMFFSAASRDKHLNIF